MKPCAGTTPCLTKSSMSKPLALDTNAFRAYTDNNPVISRLVDTAPEIIVPFVVIGELQFGAYYGSRTTENIARLERFCLSPRVIVVYPDADTTRTYGEIAAELRRAGRPIQQNDIWIAALCKQHGYILATRDTDFSTIIGLETISF